MLLLLASSISADVGEGGEGGDLLNEWDASGSAQVDVNYDGEELVLQVPTGDVPVGDLAQMIEDAYPMCRREARFEALHQYSRVYPDIIPDAGSLERALNIWEVTGSFPASSRPEVGEGCPPVPDPNHGLLELLGFASGGRIAASSVTGILELLPPERLLAIRRQLEMCQDRQLQDFHSALVISRESYRDGRFPVVGGFNMDGLPTTHSVMRRLGDAQEGRETCSGFRGFILQGSDGVITASFTGSQDERDWFNNLTNGGREQYREMMAEVPEMVRQILQEGKRLRCTGHSLGGALAQAFCARVMQEVRCARGAAFGTTPADRNAVQTITFNSLGATNMLTTDDHVRCDGTQGLDQSLATTWLATNSTHFTNDGDVVPTIQPPAYGQMRVFYRQAGNPQGRRYEPRSAHRLGTMLERMGVGQQRMGSGWDASHPVAWRQLRRPRVLGLAADIGSRLGPMGILSPVLENLPRFCERRRR